MFNYLLLPTYAVVLKIYKPDVKISQCENQHTLCRKFYFVTLACQPRIYIIIDVHRKLNSICLENPAYNYNWRIHGLDFQIHFSYCPVNGFHRKPSSSVGPEWGYSFNRLHKAKVVLQTVYPLYVYTRVFCREHVSYNLGKDLYLHFLLQISLQYTRRLNSGFIVY